MSEWTEPDTFLAQVVISDADSGPNGHLNVALGQRGRRTGRVDGWEETQEFALVHLFGNVYSLVSRQRLDREACDVYLLEIRVSDNGQPRALESVYELTVNVRDENDNVPVFVNGEGQEVKAYVFRMDEVRHVKYPTNKEEIFDININFILNRM